MSGEVLGVLVMLGVGYAVYKFVTRDKGPRSGGSGGSGGGTGEDDVRPQRK